MLIYTFVHRPRRSTFTSPDDFVKNDSIRTRYCTTRILFIFIQKFYSGYFIDNEHTSTKRLSISFSLFYPSTSDSNLPDPGLKQQITASFQANACLQESLQRVPLPVERVDDVRARLNERSLEHIGKERQNGIKRLEISAFLGDSAILNASQELGEDDEIEDERSSEEGVFALVEDVDGGTTAHENLGVIFVDRALGVADGRNVFDDDDVVGMFALGGFLVYLATCGDCDGV